MNVASSIVEFVSYLRNLGINLETNKEKLRCQAPSGVLTPNLRQQIGERKAEIIAFLQQVKIIRN